MGTFDRQIKSALRQIKAKGTVVQWNKPVNDPASDPAAPTALAPLQFNVSIVFFTNIQLTQFTTRSLIKGTELPQGAFYGLMGAQSFTPELRDWIVDGDRIYTMKPEDGIDTLAPNGQVILHTLRLLE